MEGNKSKLDEMTAEELRTPDLSENEELEEESRWKEHGRKALMGFVALVASASVALAGFFSEPAALLDRDIRIPSPSVDVMVDDDDDEGEENGQNEEETSFSEKARSFILRIPWVIRSTVGIAMWSFGWLILKMLSLLWIGLLSPLLSFLIKCLLTFLLFAAVIAAVLKLLFPWLRLRDIFNMKNLIFLIVVSVLINLCDAVLPLVWEEYSKVKTTVTFCLYAAVSVIVTVAVIKVRKILFDKNAFSKAVKAFV